MTTLPILQNPAVAARTSAATRQAFEQRAALDAATASFLSAEQFQLLRQITETLVPQHAIATTVNIAGTIDQRLQKGKSAGWRFADLPEDGEAYRRGLTVFAAMLQATPLKSFETMPPAAREGYLRCVANGDVDGPARFPLSKWLLMVRTDAVKAWLAHPSTMQAIEYFGFADGVTGNTNGPTATEGWAALTPNKALPFEQGVVTPAGEEQS